MKFVIGGTNNLDYGITNAGLWTFAADICLTDAFIRRDAADIIAIQNATTAQTFRVYNTYTSGTSYERGVFDWATTANVLAIGTEKGSSGGSTRNLKFIIAGTTKLDYGIANAGKWTFADPLVVPSYTVGALPAGVAGAEAYVTDGDAGLAWGATAINSGAGATKYLCWYNGTNWTVVGK
jgi:hypothetical protein